jgi:hypothetical protein
VGSRTGKTTWGGIGVGVGVKFTVLFTTGSLLPIHPASAATIIKHITHRLYNQITPLEIYKI